MTTKRLRVLYVTPSLGMRRGGPSTMIRAMQQALGELGCTVEVATTDDDGRSRMSPAEIPSHVNVFRRRSYFYTAAPSLGRWVHRHIADFDIVHLFALFSYPVIPVSRAARRANVPYVVSPLGSLNEWALSHYHPWLKKVSLALVERSVIRNAAAVHFNSRDEADQARRVTSFSRYVVIPPPVKALHDPSSATANKFRRRFPQIQGRRVILFLSRFDATKGLDQLIPAFADVRRKIPDVVLVLAGDGPSSASREVDTSIQRLGLEGAVLKVGFLEAEDKHAALASAEVLVQSSHTENFGISVAEAMSSGVPVVVTETSGISDVVRRSDAGIVVAPQRTEISQALITLLADPVRRKACADNGMEAAAEKFAPHHVGRKFLELYDELARS